MGTVSNRHDRGRGWEARWYAVGQDGKRRQHSRTFKTKGDAVRYLRSVEGDVVKGDFIDPAKGKTPFVVVAEKWYRTVESNLKPKTAAGYRSILEYHLLPTFGAMPVAAITAGDIRRFISNPEWKPGTRLNVLRVLSMILDDAVLDGLIRTTPMKAARAALKGLLRSESSAGLPFLDPVQVAQLAEEVGTAYRTLIYSAAYTGLRAGELAALRIRNLDLLHKTLLVEESVSEFGRASDGELVRKPTLVRPKNGKTRAVTIPAALIPMLEEQIAGKGADDFVFGGSAPLRHNNFYNRHFRPAVKRLTSATDDAPPRWPQMNLANLRFHDLRHTAASILIRNGEHLKAVSDRLGHSSITITADRYGKLYDEQRVEIADRLDVTMRAAEEEAKKLALA